MRYLAIKIDPDGMPRAWGEAESAFKAHVEADLQLEMYRAEKAKVGDPLATAEYTTKIVTRSE